MHHCTLHPLNRRSTIFDRQTFPNIFTTSPSPNPVGYNAKDAGTDLNWYAPHFMSIGFNTIDIDTVQLVDGNGMVGWGDTMQIVGPLGNAKEIYYFYLKENHPEGEDAIDHNYWGGEDLYPVMVSFDKGDAIAVDNPNGYEFTIVGSGEVVTGVVSFAAEKDLNWSGNPFASAIDINSIQLDDDGTGMVGWGDTMQIVGPLGNAKEIYYFYLKENHPDGEKAIDHNYWGGEDLYPVNVTLQPGDGFAIDNPNGYEFKIKIYAPYDL